MYYASNCAILTHAGPASLFLFNTYTTLSVYIRAAEMFNSNPNTVLLFSDRVVPGMTDRCPAVYDTRRLGRLRASRGTLENIVRSCKRHVYTCIRTWPVCVESLSSFQCSSFFAGRRAVAEILPNVDVDLVHISRRYSHLPSLLVSVGKKSVFAIGMCCRRGFHFTIDACFCGDSTMPSVHPPCRWYCLFVVRLAWTG